MSASAISGSSGNAEVDDAHERDSRPMSRLVWLHPGRTRTDEFSDIHGAHCYKATWSNEEVEHLLYLGRDIKQRRYFVGQFGFRCDGVEDFANASRDKYGHPNYALVKGTGDRNSCSMRFDLFRPG